MINNSCVNLILLSVEDESDFTLHFPTRSTKNVANTSFSVKDTVKRFTACAWYKTEEKGTLFQYVPYNKDSMNDSFLLAVSSDGNLDFRYDEDKGWVSCDNDTANLIEIFLRTALITLNRQTTPRSIVTQVFGQRYEKGFPALRFATIRLHDFLSCSIGKNDGVFFFSIREPGNFDSIFINFFRNTTSLRLTDNQWHHVCFTWRRLAVSVNIYSDGELSTVMNLKTDRILNICGNFIVGQGLDDSKSNFVLEKSFVGKITGVNFWDILLDFNTIVTLSRDCRSSWGTEVSWGSFRNGFHGDVQLIENSECLVPGTVSITSHFLSRAGKEGENSKIWGNHKVFRRNGKWISRRKVWRGLWIIIIIYCLLIATKEGS